MTTINGNRVRESPFRESEWDRSLDAMLEDLGAGQGGHMVPRMNNGVNGVNQQQQQQQFSSSMQQQSYSYSSSSQQQHQVRMQTSSSTQHQSRITAGGRSATNNYSLNKSASASSMKNNADDVLKDLETGLKKSQNYIEESHRKYEGPEGRQEWSNVRRGGDPDYSLEQQVQHMIGGGVETQQQQQQQQQSSSQNYASNQSYSSSNQNYASANQLTTYKVQSNQYGSSGERIVSHQDEEDRPASRLKQNIDDLDTLLYDLNNARHLSPDTSDYGLTAPPADKNIYGLDSDEYDESSGHQGHVKRTVQAFNEYSQQTVNTGVSSKPPSPSPRRKTQPSPVMSRKTPTSPQQRQQQQQQSYSSQQQSSYSYNSSSMMTDERQELSPPPAQHVSYSPAPAQEIPAPAEPQPSYYTKYNSSSKPTSPLPTSVAFPNHQPRSPTPQNPPKRVEELMSEFSEFDTGHYNGSPTPPMFKSKPNNQFDITELPDGPPQHHVKLDPQPHVREVTPPPTVSKSVNQKGPEVYYPPGAEFTKKVQASHPVADGGSLNLTEKKRERKVKDKHELQNMQESGDKQGAAVIPICLPLCCAAPCVIM